MMPLKPFASSEKLLSFLLPTGLPTGTILFWFLIIVFAFWGIYTIVVIYHWLRYSHASLLAFPAIAVHLFVSISLMSYILTGSFHYL